MRELNDEQLDEDSALILQATIIVGYPGLAHAGDAHVGAIGVKVLRTVVLGRVLYVCLTYGIQVAWKLLSFND